VSRTRILAAALTAAALLAPLGPLAAPAQASTCTTQSAKTVTTDGYVSDSVRTCALVRGGWSQTVTHKAKHGTVTDTTTTTDRQSVSAKGTVTRTHTVKRCTADAGTTRCTTNAS
jgi:hypothetical protein